MTQRPTKKRLDVAEVTESEQVIGLGHDPAYDPPGDLRSILRTVKLIAMCLVMLLLSAVVPLPIPGLWGGMFLFLWMAVLGGALWGGWRAGSAVLIVLIGTLFNLPLILGQGGPRYVVWEVGARGLAAALAAWVAGWLIHKASLAGSILGNTVAFLIAGSAATGVAFWLQRGARLEAVPVTLLSVLAAVIPVALVYRAVAMRGLLAHKKARS